MTVKKIVCVCALLLAVAGVASPAAPAEICLDFQTCDGLELTITGDVITGTWLNFDCDGHDAPVLGIIRDGLPLPCTPGRSTNPEGAQNPAKVGIACIWDDGCEGVAEDWDWYIILDGLDGTLDLGFDAFGNDGPPGACGVDDLRYEVLLGPCPFGPDGKGSSPRISLQQLIQRKLDQE